MERIERIKKSCFSISRFGALGSWSPGGFIASLFAIPVLLFFRSVFWFSSTLFHWLVMLFVVVVLVIIQAAYNFSPERAKREIVLDKLAGTLIAFLYVGLKWRVIVFGFILFHIFNAIRPTFFYKKISEYIERLPGAIGILGADILSGFLVNILLQIIFWVMS